ncbi:MAG: HEPN domain-containing protein [Candidatus Bathyarchaeia archaeon]
MFCSSSCRESFEDSFFVVGRGDPPKIYTVTELYTLLKESGFALDRNLEDQLYTLNRYYMVDSYPDAANGLPGESVDKLEAERALKLAEEVLSYVRRYTWGYVWRSRKAYFSCI